MARYREVPKCPWCGEVIARAVYFNRGSNFIGDSFSHWEYMKHECEQGKKAIQEFQDKNKDLFDKVNESLLKKKKP